MRGSGFAISLMLLLLAGGAAAREHGCNVESDYDLHITPKSVILLRDGSGTPGTVLMREGRLFVDDRWVALGAADRTRVLAYEREARAVMPLAQQIGRDAAEIAFTALGEVATGFSSDPARTRAKLAEARTQLDARLARSLSPTRFDGDDLGRGIAATVADVLPTLIADIVGGAVRAALGGDTARLQRMERMDREIEARVEPRARALERRAEALCQRMTELDALDDALEYRLPGGRRLELIEMRRGHR